MRLTGINAFKKYRVRVDGITVGEFFSQCAYSMEELHEMEIEYSAANGIPVDGVRIYRTRNNGKLHDQKIIPHWGKVA